MATFPPDVSNLVENGTQLFFISSESDPVGVATLRNVSLTMKSGEIGYAVSQDYQNRGVATEVVKTFVRKIFLETELRRLMAYIAKKIWLLSGPSNIFS